jgi:nitrogen fixation/metabolism regulation signal transduction histidine kinase
VRKIIEEHAGHVDISNQHGGGARVTVLLTQFVGQVDAKAQTQDNT